MEAGRALLELQNLECVRDARVLFRNLDWRVPAGEVHSLEGANGAGKSTLLRCLAGLYPDYSGTLVVEPFVYVGHKSGFSSHLTTRENLRFLRGLDSSLAVANGFERDQGNSLDIEQHALVADVAVALEQVGLAGYEHVRVAALSAGQVRRLGIARLLLSNMPLWLLDEPLTALDVAGWDLLGDVLARHAGRGGAALCATHQQLPGTTDARLQL